jgi:uncharacterized membrane protein
MNELNITPPLPPQRRFEIVKGLATGLTLIVLFAIGIISNHQALIILTLLTTVALLIILFLRNRPKMACGILLAFFAVPLLFFGACLGVMSFQ